MTQKLVGLLIPLTLFGTTRIQAQVPQGFFTDVINVGPTGQNAFEFVPYVSANGLTLYFTEGTRDVPPRRSPSRCRRR